MSHSLHWSDVLGLSTQGPRQESPWVLASIHQAGVPENLRETLLLNGRVGESSVKNLQVLDLAHLPSHSSTMWPWGIFWTRCLVTLSFSFSCTIYWASNSFTDRQLCLCLQPLGLVLEILTQSSFPKCWVWRYHPHGAISGNFHLPLVQILTIMRGSQWEPYSHCYPLSQQTHSSYSYPRLPYGFPSLCLDHVAGINGMTPERPPCISHASQGHLFCEPSSGHLTLSETPYLSHQKCTHKHTHTHTGLL